MELMVKLCEAQLLELEGFGSFYLTLWQLPIRSSYACFQKEIDSLSSKHSYSIKNMLFFSVISYFIPLCPILNEAFLHGVVAHAFL